MALDPTTDASLLSLAAELETRSAALRNGNGTHPLPPDQIKVEDAPPRLQFPRRLVPEGTSVWDTVTWETRDALIADKDGNTVFEQKHVRVPRTWSQTAVNVVASKYFRLINGVRETGVDQMIQRVSATITEWGIRDGYFDTDTAAIFAAELQYLLLHQMSSFNSPVWFNIGVPGSKNQASACFIIDVEDSMESILEWYRQEGLIFQGGSGAGVNVSKVRGKNEPLSSGGTSSGIMSFAKAADRSSGAIKSGGSVRRAAKMLQLDIDHPDIKEFITCKKHEEAKARVLIAAGYDPGLDGEAYETVAFQNANHSVVVPDAFLQAVEADGPWQLTRRVDGAVTETVSARALFRLIAETAHSCGDPGIFFSDTANQWHTTPTQGPIRGSNPCSEFLRPPDEACNLSCLNLLKFLRDDGSYDIDLFTHAVDIMITAKEILVGHSNYPTEAITKNSHAYRTLGQGYANLGGLLMAKGLPYDSDAGRNYAASITALMTGEAYVQSARLASVTGPFPGFLPDKDAMMMIIQKHRDKVNHRETNWCDADADIWDAASRVWLQAERLGYTHGYRNAQVSLLMPAGTVGLMMGCGTTGVEPDVALVNYKALVGGGTIKKVNEIVPQALQHLGYPEATIHQAQRYIETHGTLEGCQAIQEKHLPVFDCAFPTTPGGRSIHWRGHMLMVAALQPFLSMGISKTINMPHEATVEDVEAAYLEAWHRGCKSIAIYRDGSKYTQVVTTRDVAAPVTTPAAAPVPAPYRRRLPDERAALTHKFQVGDQEGYVTIGLYEDGTPGEIFIHMSKEGSTISGLIDAFATSISMALQYGVPLQALCDKFQHSRFAPSGFTHHPQIRIATSVTDYIFRYLALKFLDSVSETVTGADPVSGTVTVAETGSGAVADYGAGICPQCGGLLRITGNCSVCSSCGSSMGCS